MRVIHFYLGPQEIPCWDMFQSPAVHLFAPYKGWVQQRRKTKDHPERPLLPMSSVQPRNVKRWIQDRANKLHTKKGFLGLVVRTLSDGNYDLGIFHDTRACSLDERIADLPTQIEV